MFNKIICSALFLACTGAVFAAPVNLDNDTNYCTNIDINYNASGGANNESQNIGPGNQNIMDVPAGATLNYVQLQETPMCPSNGSGTPYLGTMTCTNTLKTPVTNHLEVEMLNSGGKLVCNAINR